MLIGKEVDMEEGSADFEAGYSDDVAVAQVEKPKVVAEQSEVESKEEAPAEVVKEEEKPDPIKELMARFEKIENRTRNVEGHIGGLTSGLKSLNETLAASKAAAKEVSEAPTQAQVKEAMENPKEWEALKGDFPEWAQATEKLLDSRLGSSKTDDFQKILEAKLEETTTRITEKVRHEAGLEALNVAFPDWTADVNTPEFAEWYEQQDDAVKALSASPKPTDAAKMMRLFSNRKPKPVEEPKQDLAASRQERMKAAITPKGTGGTPSSSDIDDFMAGYTG